MKMINTIIVIIFIAVCSGNLAAEEMVRPRTLVELRALAEVVRVHSPTAVTIRIDSDGLLPPIYLRVHFTHPDRFHFERRPYGRKVPIMVKFVIIGREAVPLSRLKEASKSLVSRRETTEHYKFVEKIAVYDRTVFHQDWATFLSDDALRPPGFITPLISPERPR